MGLYTNVVRLINKAAPMDKVIPAMMQKFEIEDLKGNNSSNRKIKLASANTDSPTATNIHHFILKSSR